MSEQENRRPVIAMEYSGPWRVKLTYFKASGKYYGEGEYTSKQLALFEIWEEVQYMFAMGERPGLVDGKNYFNTLVEVPDHPRNQPRLIMSREREE